MQQSNPLAVVGKVTVMALQEMALPNRPVALIAYILCQRHVHFAVATCNLAEDEYNANTGTNIAIERLMDSYVQGKDDTLYAGQVSLYLAGQRLPVWLVLHYIASHPAMWPTRTVKAAKAWIKAQRLRRLAQGPQSGRSYPGFRDIVNADRDMVSQYAAARTDRDIINKFVAAMHTEDKVLVVQGSDGTTYRFTGPEPGFEVKGTKHTGRFTTREQLERMVQLWLAGQPRGAQVSGTVTLVKDGNHA